MTPRSYSPTRRAMSVDRLRPTLGPGRPRRPDRHRLAVLAASTFGRAAIGVAMTGERRVLGLELAAGNDDESAWPAFILRLVERGLHGVRLVISDDHVWDVIAGPARGPAVA